MVAPPLPVVTRISTGRQPLWPAAVPTVVIIGVAGLFGLWWAAPLAGLLMGLAYGRARAVGAAAVAGLLGWALALAWQEVRMSLGPVADTVAGIMGLGSGVVAVLVALLIPALLAGSAAWVGVAVRRLVETRRSSRSGY